MSNVKELLKELVDSLDAIDEEAKRVEKTNGKGWSSAPVIRSLYAREAAKKFLQEG